MAEVLVLGVHTVNQFVAAVVPSAGAVHPEHPERPQSRYTLLPGGLKTFHVTYYALVRLKNCLGRMLEPPDVSIGDVSGDCKVTLNCADAIDVKSARNTMLSLIKSPPFSVFKRLGIFALICRARIYQEQWIQQGK